MAGWPGQCNGLGAPGWPFYTFGARGWQVRAGAIWNNAWWGGGCYPLMNTFQKNFSYEVIRRRQGPILGQKWPKITCSGKISVNCGRGAPILLSKGSQTYTKNIAAKTPSGTPEGPPYSFALKGVLGHISSRFSPNWGLGRHLGPFWRKSLKSEHQ